MNVEGDEAKRLLLPGTSERCLKQQLLKTIHRQALKNNCHTTPESACLDMFVYILYRYISQKNQTQIKEQIQMHCLF